MSKFIAFVAALLVSTLSFAQQFITFTKDNVDIKEGLLISQVDTLVLNRKSVDSDCQFIKGSMDFNVIVDCNMTIKEVLEQGYSLAINVMPKECNAQLQDSQYSVIDFRLYDNDLYGGENNYGTVDFRDRNDNGYSEHSFGIFKEDCLLKDVYRKTSCTLKKS